MPEINEKQNDFSIFLLKIKSLYEEFMEKFRMSEENRINLKQGGFSIFLVAFVLTIFEILFFYNNVIPEINSQKVKGLNGVSKKLAKYVNTHRKNLIKITNSVNLSNMVSQEIVSPEMILQFYLKGFYILVSNKNNLQTIIDSIPNEEDLPENYFENLIKNGNIVLSQNETSNVSLDENVTLTMDTFTNTSNNKNKVIDNINTSDLDPDVKDYLIEFINSNLDYPERYKKLFLNLLNKEIPEKNPILETLEYREGLLRKKINNYVVITGGLIILTLFILLMRLRSSIKNEPNYDSYKINFRVSIFSSLFTIFTLIVFQIGFYFLGKQYMYTMSGLTKCSNKDLDDFIGIKKITENKKYTKKEALEYIFDEIKSQNNKYNLDINYPKNKQNNKCDFGGKIKNNKCVRTFRTCHYLESETNKYGDGDTEFKLLLLNKIKI